MGLFSSLFGSDTRVLPTPDWVCGNCNTRVPVGMWHQCDRAPMLAPSFAPGFMEDPLPEITGDGRRFFACRGCGAMVADGHRAHHLRWHGWTSERLIAEVLGI